MVIYFIITALLLISVILIGGYFYCLSYIFEMDASELPKKFKYTNIMELAQDIGFPLRLIRGDWGEASSEFHLHINRARVFFISACLTQIILLISVFILL